MHQHNEPCGCGQTHEHNHEHHHEHGEPCGCGHTHGQTQAVEPCGCGHTHDHAHDQAQAEPCGCGHTHDHAHDQAQAEPCGCGHTHGHDHKHHHEHHHEHGEHCGCGHSHTPVPTPEGLSNMQVDILLALRQRQCLPVACFSLAKTDDDERYCVSLAPVYMGTPEDTMEQVKQIGAELKALEQADLLTLDYDIPLSQYAYEEYKTSALYAYFVQTVAQAAAQPNATFDTPTLELGSMALTDAGQDMVDKLLAQVG